MVRAFSGDDIIYYVEVYTSGFVGDVMFSHNVPNAGLESAAQ